jgi:RNA-binding protein
MKKPTELKPEFNIGKNGITDTFLDSVDKYLDKHEMVKIKVSIAEDKDAMKYYANEVANELKAEILDIRGFTFVICKKK